MMIFHSGYDSMSWRLMKYDRFSYIENELRRLAQPAGT